MIELPKRARPATNADINIVPYIDVMLVLLVIFMMTTPIIQQGMEVDLPEGPTETLNFSDGPQPTVITISPDNKLYINSLLDVGIEEIGDTEPVSISVIVSQVKARRKIYPEMDVIIRGDKKAGYGQVYNVMMQLAAHGINKAIFSAKNPN